MFDSLNVQLIFLGKLHRDTRAQATGATTAQPHGHIMIKRDQRPHTISIGIHVPAADTEQLGSRDDYAQFFRAAEDLGFDALWTEDRILYPSHLASV